MQRALIIGDTGGIGQAIAAMLLSRGVEVTGLSRSRNGMDVTSEEAVMRNLSALEGTFDLIFVATGALEIGGNVPEKALNALSAEAMHAQFAVNAIGPALILKHARDLLPKDRPAVFAALSARVGSIGDNRLGGWYAYRAAKAALNQIIRTAAIELARSHKQAVCVALHPGTVETEFTAKYRGRHPAVAANDAARNLLAVIDGLSVDQSGGFYDWAGKAIEW